MIICLFLKGDKCQTNTTAEEIRRLAGNLYKCKLVVNLVVVVGLIELCQNNFNVNFLLLMEIT